MPDVTIELAAERDHAGIVRLMQANQRDALSEEERRHGGYLSAVFTLEQVARLAGDVAIVVARDGDEIAGFAVLSRSDGDPAEKPAIERRMVETFPRALFRGRPLSEYGACVVWGPVCIDRGRRGGGLLRRMYAKGLEAAAGRFAAGVSLVADQNPRSLHAHVDGLGMEDVATFDSGGVAYHLLAFAPPAAP